MIFCSNCGESVMANSHFCAKCGNKLMGNQTSEFKSLSDAKSPSSYFDRLKKLHPQFWVSLAAVCLILSVAIPSLNLALSVPCEYVTFQRSYGTVMNGGWATCYSAFDGKILSGFGNKVYSGASLKGVEILLILGSLLWVYYLIKVYRKAINLH